MTMDQPLSTIHQLCMPEGNSLLQVALTSMYAEMVKKTCSPCGVSRLRSSELWSELSHEASNRKAVLEGGRGGEAGVGHVTKQKLPCADRGWG